MGRDVLGFSTISSGALRHGELVSAGIEFVLGFWGAPQRMPTTGLRNSVIVAQVSKWCGKVLKRGVKDIYTFG